MHTEEKIIIKTEIDRKGFEEGLIKMQEAAAKGTNALSGELTIATRALEQLSKSAKNAGMNMERSMESAQKSVEGVKPEAGVKGFQALREAAQKGVDSMLKVNEVEETWQKAAKGIKAFESAQELATVTANGGLTVMQTGVALLTGKIGAQTIATGMAAKAQAVLNGVMNLNPIFLGGAAIVAIFASALGDMNEQQAEATRKTEETNQALEEQKIAQEEAAAARVSTANEAVSEITHAELLIERLDDMVDSNGRVKKGYEERAQMLTDEINTIIPNAISLAEKEGDTYLKVADNLDALVTKQRTAAILEAKQPAYLDALANIAQNRDAHSAVEIELERKEDEIEELKRKQEEFKKNNGFNSPSIENQVEAAEIERVELQAEFDMKKQAYEDNKIAMEEYKAAEDAYYSGKTEIMEAENERQLTGLKNYTTLSAEERDAQLATTVRSYSNAVEAATLNGKEMTEAEAENIRMLGERVADEMGQYTGLGGVVSQGIINELVAAEPELAAALKGLFDKGLIDEGTYTEMMATLGKNGNAAFAKGIADSEGKNLIATNGETVGDTAIHPLQDFINRKVSEDLGRQFTIGYSLGLIDPGALNFVNLRARRGVKEAVTAVQSEGDSHSPSRVAMALGTFFTEGLALGIIDPGMLTKVAENATTLARTTIDTVSKLFGGNSAFAMGKGWAEGGAKGVDLGLSATGMLALEGLSALSDQSIALVREKATSYKEVGTLYIKNMGSGIDGGIDDLIKEMQKVSDAQLEAELAGLDKNDEAGKKKCKEISKERMDTFKDAVKKGGAEAKALIGEKMSGITEEAQKQYDAVLKAQQQMENKLSSYGKPYTIDEEGNMVLEDIDSQIDALTEYEEALNALKDNGASKNLMDQVLSMGVDEATEFVNTMLKKGNGFIGERSEELDEKEDLSASIAEKFFAEDKNLIEEKFVGDIALLVEKLPEECAVIGETTITGIIQGLENKEDELYEKIREIVKLIFDELKTATETASPSKRAAREVGAPLSQGIAKGMRDAYDPKEMQQYTHRMLGDIGQAQNRAAFGSIGRLCATGILNSTTNNGGDFVLKIEKVINDGKGSVTSLLQEAEFYRKQTVMAKGGA